MIYSIREFSILILHVFVSQLLKLLLIVTVAAARYLLAEYSLLLYEFDFTTK